MFARINSLGLYGLNAFSVSVEIEAARGIEELSIVGLADAAVRESRERLKSAFRSSGLGFPKCKLTVNLAPADMKKTGSLYDLPIAAALLAVNQAIPATRLESAAFIGEISLNGELRAGNGVLPMALLARQTGIRELYVPAENAFEASVADGLTVYGVSSLAELVFHFSGKVPIQPTQRYVPPAESFYGALDFADVKGQQAAKQALEIAASGGHNVLMLGAPGSGKSMLAKRMPSILPAMTFDESIETTNVYSVAGMVDKNSPLITARPFRAPHHTISSAGLTGGGSVPRPGEISLANNGLLFLDELAEFNRQTLEILRQPLEEGKVTISRAAGTVTYPCAIMLIAAMNPCPCGYFGHPTRKCICTKKQVSQYLSRISGPLLDRFDIHIEVAPAEYEHLASAQKAESSVQIRRRVATAREVQLKRFAGTKLTCNAMITPDILHEVCPVSEDASTLLKNVFERMGLSARAYDRILKVSRTIADMDGEEIIQKRHCAQAVQYRSLDRKYWA